MSNRQRSSILYPPSSFPPPTAFTLVELLVVIGVIAVLVAILLPALQKSRKQAIQIQCCSNLRQVGMAVAGYSLTNKGCVMPTLVWGPGSKDDEWSILLVAGHFLPDNHLTASSPVFARTPMVCPAISDICITSNVSGVTVIPVGGQNDGFDRRVSYHIQPGLIVDYGYGINGATYRSGPAPGLTGGDGSLATLQANYFKIPSTSISIDPNETAMPLKRMSSLRKTDRLVMFFDGTEWNPWSNIAVRLTASRHGKWDPKRPYTTGIVNILFADGHVASANRADLPQPDTAGSLAGTKDWNGKTPRHPDYLFNITQ